MTAQQRSQCLGTVVYDDRDMISNRAQIELPIALRIIEFVLSWQLTTMQLVKLLDPTKRL